MPSVRGTLSGQMGKAGVKQFFGPLQSPFRSRPEATVIEMLALSLILALLPCSTCFSHTKQLIIYKHPRPFQAFTVLGPSPAFSHYYSRFGSHSTSSEEPPLGSWAAMFSSSPPPSLSPFLSPSLPPSLSLSPTAIHQNSRPLTTNLHLSRKSPATLA